MYVTILERGRLGPGVRGVDGEWAEGSMPLEQAFKEHGEWIQQVEVAKRAMNTEEESGEVKEKEAKGVRSLELRGCGLEDMTTRKVAHIIRVNTTVTMLNLAFNKVSDEGAAYLGEALKSNTTLVSLDLSRNELGDRGCERLAQGLLANSSLTSLCLDFNHSIQASGVSAVAGLLHRNSGISTLTLSGLSIKAKGASELSAALLKNNSLQRLEMNDALLGPEGGVAMARALEPNANLSLTWLDLACNALGDNGARAIAVALRPKSVLSKDAETATGAESQARTILMPTLTSLDMRNNGLGPASMTELAAALKHNRILRRLLISENKCGDSGAQAIVRALEYNQTLQTLLFYDNSIGVETCETISLALLNRPLKSVDMVFQLANDSKRQLRAGDDESAANETAYQDLTLNLLSSMRLVPAQKQTIDSKAALSRTAATSKSPRGKKNSPSKGKKSAKGVVVPKK